MNTTTSISRAPRALIWLVMGGVLVAVLASIVPWSTFLQLGSRLNLFATVFLGIFIEALPYLLFGTLVSGLVEVFLERDVMARVISKRAVPAAISGALMGLVFPVCECGVIPLTRRLFHKGLPLSAGIAFLLAAPVMNPIVIFSTSAAFGWGQMLVWRVGLTVLIAIIVGLVFSVEKDPANVLRPTVLDTHDHDHSHAEESASFGDKIQQALLICADEFFEMGRFLVIGAMLAAGLQTFIPQESLLSIGSGPILSVMVMLALAIILSICSTVDAFVALGFSGAFSFGSILSFLVFGPMVDIKSTLMYLQVFRRKSVGYLILLPLLMSLLAGLAFNYFAPKKGAHMPKRLYRSFQALVLLALFIFLMSKIFNNQLLWYINQRFVVLTQIGIIFLAILTQRLFSAVRESRMREQADEHDHDHEHAPAPINLWIMLVPLLIGVLIPAKPLDSNAVAAKGLTTSSALISSDSTSRLLETESEQRNILDWVKLFYFEQDLNPYIGQKASVVGFVYPDESLPEGQFFVSRFILSCCAADGYAVGMIVETTDSNTFEADTWLKVSGSVEVVSYNGRPSPLIRAEAIEIVPQPDQPYLYP